MMATILFQFLLRNEVVHGIVNDHVIGMVGERPRAIGDEKTEPPIPNPSVRIPYAIAVCMRTSDTAINGVTDSAPLV